MFCVHDVEFANSGCSGSVCTFDDFFLPVNQYAAYSEECQRLHYYEAANITECKVTHPPTEMADIQGKPDPAAKEIINRLLAETGQASKYSTTTFPISCTIH